MNQPSEFQKKTILDQILNSPEFHDSKRYQELLQYLVAKTSCTDSLKETEIAHDIFGKDSKFDPSSDPLIRSYISNLRKKLEHYYLTTTDNYDFKLEIPKGHYLVKYRSVEKLNEIQKKFKLLPFVYPAIILILLSTIIFMVIGRQAMPASVENPLSGSPIWKDFMKKDSQPTLIVLGDFIVLSEKGKNNKRTFLRVPQINNENELAEYSKIDPGKFGNLEISEVSYIGAAASLGVAHIIKSLSGSLQNVTVKLSHELKWDDFENHNVIFIGTFKNLYKLDTLFSRTNIRYSLEPNSLSILDKQNDTIHSYSLDWHGGNYQKDYSVILKLMGSKNNTVMFLTGFSEVGVMESVKSCTDPNLLTRIDKFSGKNIAQDPFLFEMISETEGVRYTVFRSDIKYFKILQNPIKK